MNSLDDVLTFLNECEAKFPVAEWEIDGVHVWPLIRMEVRIHIIHTMVLKSGAGEYAKRSPMKILLSFAKRAAKNYLQIKRDSEMDDTLNKRDVLFFTGGIGYVDYFGASFERFFDPFKMYFDKVGVSMLRLDSSESYEEKRFSLSLYVKKKLNLVVAQKMFFPAKKTKRNIRLEKFEAFVAYANSCGVATASLKEDYLKVRVKKVLAAKTFFRGYLQKVQPTLVMVTNYYNDFSFALINECRDQGISTMDIQHGVQGRLHSAYGGWSSVPTSGFNVLPDYFWCWSEDDAREINSWSKSISRHVAIPGGNLFLGLIKDRSTEFFRKYQASFERKKSRSSNLEKTKPNVLVSLQTNMTSDDVLGEVYETILGSVNEYNWWVRLHPAMISGKNKLVALLENKGIVSVEIELATETPLYVLLQNMDVHVTHSSSVVLEATHFGVPSIVVSEYGLSLYKKEIDSGSSFFCKFSSEISFKLSELSLEINNRESKRQEPSFTTNRYLEELSSLL
jgi:hypothetical protein